MIRIGFIFKFALAATLTFHSLGFAASVTWIGGDNNWVDGIANDANWSPADEPDTDDTAIFNTGNAVNMGSNNSILALTMSGGVDVFTNDFDLTVDGLVQLSGSGTNLFIGDSAGSTNADNVTINSGARVELSGGLLTLDEESGTSLLDINSGGTLQGRGTITFADTPLIVTTLLTNDGTLTALSRPSNILLPPPVGTLQINDSSIGGRVNLDGVGEAGVVNVNRNQTLDLNVPMTDAFSGSMSLFQNSTFDSSGAWTLDTGTLNADNGATGGIGGSPAGPSTIAGGAFTQTGGTITVVDNDGELRFNSTFAMNGGTLTNNGLVVFNNDATIAAGANFTMPTNNSSITVGAERTVTINQANFNADGNGNPTNVLTIEDDGILHLNLGLGADLSFGSQIVLKGGTLVVQPSAGAWSIDGDISVPSGFTASVINGSPVTLTAVTTNIVGDGLLNFVPTTTFGLGASFTGDGTLVFSGQVNVNNATTINMSGGTIDLDGVDNIGDFINIDAPLVINAATLNSFGKFNGGGGINTLDVDARTVGTNGKLTVNLDNPNSNWVLNSTGVLNLSGPNAGATLLEGSDVVINGILNATGGAFVTARVQLGGAININAASALTFGGGSFANPNRLNGGIINGPGNFFSGGSTATVGFGTINAEVNFVGNGRLLADDGVLTVNGPILAAGRLGTADNDGVLNVVNPWSTSTTSAVTLDGGELKGGTVTNNGPNGINGFGLLSSRVLNTTKLSANSPGQTLVVETAANDNDWDGAGSGELHAGSSATLELRDTATFGFTGTVTAEAGGRVLANGFALDFNPGSSLQLGSSGIYESTNSTDIGGTVTVNAGGDSTIRVANNRFLTFQSTSSTTLNGNLILDNNNIDIQAGATFSGTGALIIPDGSHLVIDNGATINALVVNEGTYRPSGFFTPGAVTLKDYSQSNDGELIVDLTGTLLNQFDRVLVTGNAQLDGQLLVQLAGGLDPVLGTTFDILSTAFGVSGQFDNVDCLNLPAGKAFHVDYLANSVRLTVVNRPFLSADFDHDGDVDTTDYAIWRGAFHLNQLGDATGDGISDAADYVVWRKQLGSVPSSGAAAIGAVPEPATMPACLAVLAALIGNSTSRVRSKRNLFIRPWPL